MAKFFFTGFYSVMRIDRQDRTTFYTYPSQRLAFKGSAEELGKQIGDIFCKSVITTTEKLSLLDKFRKAWSDIVNTTHVLGKGFRGTVYKIDDDFAMKVRNVNMKSPQEAQTIEFGKNQFKNLETYFGEPIGSIGTVKILRNLGTHLPAGIPETVIKTLKSENEMNNYYNKVYLPAFAKVPQESYDAIARDFSRLNNMPPLDGEYFSFDGVNPNNIVLSDNKLRLTDDIDTILTKDSNTSGKLIDILLYRVTRLKRAENYGTHKKDALEILKKIVIASEKANLPYETLDKDVTAWEKVLENLKLDMDLVVKLETLRYSYPDMSARLQQINKLFDSFIL